MIINKSTCFIGQIKDPKTKVKKVEGRVGGIIKKVKDEKHLFGGIKTTVCLVNCRMKRVYNFFFHP